VRVILEEVERLDRIVTSLLQYARPRTPELQRVPLGPCIEKVVALTRDAVSQAGISVSMDVPTKLAPLYLDPDLATQVLLNVTLNAIQAMPAGGSLRYEVRALRRRVAPRSPGRRQTDQRGTRGERVRPWRLDQQVRVIDTGPGIPRGALAKLFDPFFSTRPRGTGLGLSISQTIMQEHGGTISVASREGRGTTVLLNFPVEKRHGERRQHDTNPKR
jgi:two-component system sensor histidine kinase HydH